MANLKTIQFLRNANLSTYSDMASAKEALIAKARELELTDGSPIAGRYTVTVSGSPEVRTVLGVVYANGNTTGVTFFNNDKEFENVLDGLDYGPIGGTEASVLTQIQQADGKISGLTANVGTLKLTDYTKGSDSGSVVNTDSINAALSKLENQIDAANDVIEALDYNLAADDNKVVVSLNQTDGAVSGTSVNISGIKLAGYSEGTDADIAATDTLGEALGKLQAQINAMDLTVVSGDGEVITAVSENDGKVSAEKSAIKDVKLTGYVKDDSKTGDLAATDDIEDALSKIENNIAAAKSATTLSAADKSINVVTAATGTTVALNIRSGEKVLKLDADATSGGVYTDIKLSAVTPSSTTVKEEYSLIATDGTALGTNIKIYKDSSVVKISYITDPSDAHYQNLEYQYIDVSGNTQTEYVDMSTLVLEAEFASGVTADASGVVHGVVDTNSEKDESNVAFLTVGADGFKISGIKDAIDTKINKLNADLSGNTTHVTVGVAEADGKITAVTVAEDDIASATALTQEITDRETADTELSNRIGTGVTTVNTATAQLAALSGNSSTDTSATTSVEGAKRYADAKLSEAVADLDAEVSGETADGKVNVKVTEVDGKITAVDVVGTDIASANDLTAEIAARKDVDGQDGQTYAANTTANYISAATSLNDADVKLDAALKTADDAMLTGVAAGNGISVSAKSGKSQTITAVAKSSDPVIEVTSNGIGVKEDAVWDCGTF